MVHKSELCPRNLWRGSKGCSHLATGIGKKAQLRYKTAGRMGPSRFCNIKQREEIMGLFNKIRTALAGQVAGVPAAASFATRAGVVYAPATGMLMSLREVNDEAVSDGLLGEGYGILPVGDGVLYAPCDCRVGATTVTNHAIGLSTADGVEILIHVGIGTVDMDGKGFERFVESNDEVSAGAPLIRFDSQAIAAAGHDDVIVVAVSNADDFDELEHVGDSGTLLGGRPLVKIGDPLLVVGR